MNYLIPLTNNRQPIQDFINGRHLLRRPALIVLALLCLALAQGARATCQDYCGTAGSGITVHGNDALFMKFTSVAVLGVYVIYYQS